MVLNHGVLFLLGLRQVHVRCFDECLLFISKVKVKFHTLQVNLDARQRKLSVSVWVTRGAVKGN